MTLPNWNKYTIFNISGATMVCNYGTRSPHLVPTDVSLTFSPAHASRGRENWWKRSLSKVR